MKTLPSRAAHRAATVAMAIVLLAVLVAPAHAGSSFSYRVTGRSASTYWTQVDGTPTGGPVGNVHIGWLNAEETAKGLAAVFGYIQDWDCEDGEVPGWPGHGEDDEPQEGLCDWVGDRYIESWDITFTMNNRLNHARLTGRLTVYGGGHGDGGVVGRPQADIVWTGVGSLSRGQYTSRWRDGNTWYSDSYRSTDRNATMGGILGPMGFDPDLSGGWLSTWKASSTQRTR